MATFVIAAALVVGYGLVFNIMARTAHGNWDRLNYLFNGAEAVAFSAIGWMFSDTIRRSEIQRANASTEAAQSDAETERDRAERSRGDALAGRAMEASVRARVKSARGTVADGPLRARPDTAFEALDGPYSGETDPDRQFLLYLLDLAAELRQSAAHDRQEGTPTP